MDPTHLRSLFSAKYSMMNAPRGLSSTCGGHEGRIIATHEIGGYLVDHMEERHITYIFSIISQTERMESQKYSILCSTVLTNSSLPA